ncbi:MAG: diguanylate cyclase [Bdellovibrionales bacterium]|nr:diguanylate cyclase [Bdellovibrionales bacterium]
MNLQPYRSSFVVFVADSHLERGRDVCTALEDSGYNTEHRVSIESLWEEIIKNPPHIVLFYYSDDKFFPNDSARLEAVEKLQSILPEVQIIMLCEEQHLHAACTMYEFGIYDCLVWPTQHPLQLLRAVDRAAENDYYMYLNEQLNEASGGDQERPSVDFAMFNIWYKSLESTKTKEQAIQVWLKEAIRIFKTDTALFFSYLESKKSLVASDAVGLGASDLRDVGLDLAEREPGFETSMLLTPHRVRALHDFVSNGLLREQALFFSLIHEGKVLGIFIIPAKKGQIFKDNEADSGYMQTCLLMMQRHFSVLSLTDKYKKFSVYDDESEVLNFDFMFRKIREEISRARRITRPVSLLRISIDHFEDLTLSNTDKVMSRLLKSFSEILVANSRLNDLIGRFERDQFLVCLPHTDRRGAAVKAERLRRIIESADVTSILGGSGSITVSIGISEYPYLCHDIEGLLKSSESALLEIKKVGHNKICLAAQPLKFVPDFVVKDAKDAAAHSR